MNGADILADYNSLIRLIEEVREMKEIKNSYNYGKLDDMFTVLINRRVVLEEILNSKDEETKKIGLQETRNLLKVVNQNVQLLTQYSEQDVSLRLVNNLVEVIQKINLRL